jgi:hypothetical protein
MNRNKRHLQNPRYIGIPTLLIALVCGHVSQIISTSYGLSELSSTIIYVVALGLPIVTKRLFTSHQESTDQWSDQSAVTRLPTTRFMTKANYASFSNTKRK